MHTLSSLHPNQFCIRNADSQIEAVKRVRRNIAEGFSDIIAVDFKNAYGMIRRSHIISQLERMGAAPTLIRYIVHLLNKQLMHFTDSTGAPRTIEPTRGVAQGDPTSSLLHCC